MIFLYNSGMALSPTPNIAPDQQTYALIADLIRQFSGSSEDFISVLHQERISHLSYSRLSAVEFCPQRYSIEYILMADQEANPEYFNKGKTFHQLAADVYNGMAQHQPLDPCQLVERIEEDFDGENRKHLLNALILLLANLWEGYEVVGIEQPFVMPLGPDLPPCVGVIDLILRKGNQFLVIDHKTGRDFPSLDGFQLAIYREYIQNQFAGSTCETYFDCYRWVNHLDRIRKPAFQRSHLSSNLTRAAINQRFSAGYEIIQRLETTRSAPHTGECYRCPHRKFCWRS